MSVPCPIPSEWSWPGPPSNVSSYDEPQNVSSPFSPWKTVPLDPDAERWSAPFVPRMLQLVPQADRSTRSKPTTVADTGWSTSRTRRPEAMFQVAVDGSPDGLMICVWMSTRSWSPRPPSTTWGTPGTSVSWVNSWSRPAPPYIRSAAGPRSSMTSRPGPPRSTSSPPPALISSFPGPP
ncbi:MAG: hypothetical protein WB797_09605 [Nocardioides sp.]